ncbi:MAG: hypothetical protein C4530_04430, partial [Desulfobacteraceae bacterium]
MSTHSIEKLNEKIRGIQRRRKWIFALRQAVFGSAAVIAFFLILSLIEMRFYFASKGRIGLFCLLSAGAVFLFWRQFRIIRRFYSDALQLAHYVEEKIPGLQQRLMTSIEYREKDREGVSAQLVERLWEDAHAQMHSRRFDRRIDRIASARTVWPAAGAFLSILGLALAGTQMLPDFSRAGREILWPWSLPAYSPFLTVSPGDARIARGEDVVIAATIHAAASGDIHLYVQEEGAGWRRIPMTGREGKKTYLHFLSSIQKDLAYYVDMGRDRSQQHRISVFDPLRIERIDATYHYPEYTGLGTKVEKDAGDLTAPKGTRVALKVVFNKPVDRADLRFREGDAVKLSSDGTAAFGEFTVRTDTAYTIEAKDREQEKNSDPFEYFVKAVPDAPPEIELTLPGKDRRVMPLEEVPIAAAAGDDYGLTKFVLNYQVAGGKGRELSLLAPEKRQEDRGDVAVDGKALIYLEDLAVSPGDFVTFYLAAADNNTVDGPAEVLSDIYFLQVIPTDEEFRKAPQGGGGAMGGMGGGMGQQDSALVENQKNVIAATWKLLGQKTKTPGKTLDNEIEIVAESQQKVLQRTRMSMKRLTERVSLSDETYDRAVAQLTEAIVQMEAATEKLSQKQLKEALGPETAALQAILKAESESRVTQILAQQMGGGGAGGGGGGDIEEREDLRDLFEMEMGRLENRYELPPQAAARREQAEEEDIFKKLRELADRQEQLNRAQRELADRSDRMTEEESRRRLEELRREQEMLSRQSEALSRRMSRFARSTDNRQLEDRSRKMDQAAQQMREAAESLLRQNPQTAALKGDEALENLKEQKKQTASGEQGLLTRMMDALGRKAGKLKAQEKGIQKDLEDAIREQTTGDPFRKVEALKTAKEEMKEDLKEVEALLRALGRQKRQAGSELTDKAHDTLRLLDRERVGDRIEKTREMLSQGLLSLSAEEEKHIESAIDRIGKRLENLDGGSGESKENPLERAVAEAGGLRRELEMLEKQIEALRQGSQGRTSRKPEAAGAAGSRNPDPEGPMNESLQ